MNLFEPGSDRTNDGLGDIGRLEGVRECEADRASD